MSRRTRYEINQRLAALQERIDELDHTRPSRAAPLELFDVRTQQRFLREGNVRNGKVYT